MSVIQKIRDKYAKLAGFVIALALVGFILSDAASGNLADLFGNKTTVVEVNGDKVDQKEYMQRINDYEAIYQLYGGRTLDDMLKAQVHDQVLRELIFERIINEELDALGIVSSKEEENDIIKGANTDPMIQQFPYFRNPETGGFDMNALQAFEGKQIDMSNPNAEKAMQEWEIVKRYVKRNHKMQQYNNLIVNGIYQPGFLIKQQIKDQHQVASISYVKIPFNTVDDNDPAAKVTDADIQAYIKKRAAQYTIDDPTRTIEYVTFDITPSTEDTAQVLQELNRISGEFGTASDMEIFLGRHSDEPYPDLFVNRRSFMSVFADSIMDLPVGSVFGPYYEEGFYKLTKVVDKQVLPDSVTCRHILVRTAQQGQTTLSDSAAKQRIDSVMLALKSGADFNQMVLQYSDDEGSKNAGGEYVFTLQQRPQISKEFADFIFEGKTGQTKVVKVENNNYAGYHYIEIVSQSNPEPVVKLASVVKTFMPSQLTNQEVFSRASEFAGRNTDAKAFDEAAKAGGLDKRVASNIKVNDFIIEGVGPSREIIRWVFEAEKGTVSPIFNLDNRYVVAKLTDIQEKGLMKPDANNRPMLEAAVKAEKKAGILKEKYKEVKDLESLAATSGQQVGNADSFNASSTYLPFLGPEPKVVGYAFYEGFKPNTVSPAIKGQDGIFFISLKGRHETPVEENPFMVSQQKQMMEMQLKNSISGGLMDVLRRKAKIEYNGELLY